VVIKLFLVGCLTTLSVSRPHSTNDTMINEHETAVGMRPGSYGNLKFNNVLHITKLFSLTSLKIIWFISWLLFVTGTQCLVCELENELFNISYSKGLITIA
jgi:hypothetical protein